MIVWYCSETAVLFNNPLGVMGERTDGFSGYLFGSTEKTQFLAKIDTSYPTKEIGFLMSNSHLNRYARFSVDLTISVNKNGRFLSTICSTAYATCNSNASDQ